MRYVGLDLGWKVSAIHVRDRNGRKLSSRKIHGPWLKVLAELMKVKRPFAICFEASTGYGWMYERLKEMASRVEVAHPGSLRMIFKSKRKSDRIDAEKLAKLLYLDEVPTVHVPSLDVRSWRGMIEHRSRLVQRRTGIKSALRALLRGQAIVAPRSLWSRKGMTWLEGLEFANGLLTVRRDLFVEEVRRHDAMLKRVEKELDEVGRRHPGVRLLRTIPGVGPRTAEAVMAYVDVPERFHSNRSIGCYFGIVPCQDESAGRNRLGHITKQGPSTVRRLVVEAAWQAVRHSPAVRKRFQKMLRADPKRKKRAIVAVAHYLFRVMLAMLQHGEQWREKSA
jgi:transposase